MFSIRKVCFMALFCMLSGFVNAQERQLYLGAGTGLDYGGLGGKVEYLPVKNFGLFAGIGFNLIDLAWNAGATYKIAVSQRVSINPMVMYGYNGVSLTFGEYPEYEKVSYGLSFGANVDVRLGAKGNKLSAGLLFPIQSDTFLDNYDAMKKDPRIFTYWKSPVLISVGYNFRMR